eukprot:Gb_10263 [translate_table: standard]
MIISTGGRSTGIKTSVYRLVFSVLRAMGGDPLITESSFVKMDDDIKEILDKVGLLEFFQKFTSKFCKLFGHHIAILNSIQNSTKINLPLFLLRSLEKSIKSFKSSKGKLPLHQVLLKILVKCEKPRILSPSLTLKGHLRSSGTPVSRAQLLLGPTVAAPKSSAESSELVEEEESPSGDCGISSCKRGTSQKWKPAPQTLAVSLPKCSRRSSRLQKKFVEKVKIVDDVVSSEEEKIEKEDVNLEDLRRKKRDSVPVEESKDTAKVLPENQNVLKELRSHLKILNGMGGSLTGTYACINLLSLEIINYLKEVVSCLKDLNSRRP